VFKFESIVIACIRVAVCAFQAAPVIDPVAGLLADTGRFSHFSMINVLAPRLPTPMIGSGVRRPLEFGDTVTAA